QNTQDDPAAVPQADEAGVSPETARGLWQGPGLWLPLAIIVVDQVTKAMVRLWLPLHASRTVVAGFLDFTHVQNTGAAFGLLNTVDFPFKSTVIALVASAALAGIAVYAARLSPHQRVARIGLALVIAGAAGNLIDRLTIGPVIDFVDFYWGSFHFWAFNVADSAITAGVGLMMLDMLGLGSHAPKTA
ncbi:MAG: signal peptidase II, partial [Planctomycetes bacterium]|nr:signal peptidase II [Planctomycetota bacterium]